MVKLRPPRKLIIFQTFFKYTFGDDAWSGVTDGFDGQVNIGGGHDLVPSDPLPQPILTKIDNATWRN